ncbi:hypothetical protein A9Q91_00665 [Candidatus Gracilibacteria bacterium 28_42_T64]|nr:hypothetical protein A9Q91_00665 [Candidatus Gracilibacteria bacterium 28_42_T64]
MKNGNKAPSGCSLLDGAVKFEEASREDNIMSLSSLGDIYYELRLYTLARIFYLGALGVHREGKKDDLSICFVKEMNLKIKDVEKILADEKTI